MLPINFCFGAGPGLRSGTTAGGAKVPSGLLCFALILVSTSALNPRNSRQLRMKVSLRPLVNIQHRQSTRSKCSIHCCSCYNTLRLHDLLLSATSHSTAASNVSVSIPNGQSLKSTHKPLPLTSSSYQGRVSSRAIGTRPLQTVRLLHLLLKLVSIQRLPTS